MIRTPDQRVRVFVSSTLQELLEERNIVKQAIEDLRLIPVMFELGAKAHPPRQLYVSYVEQSDIFIAIYWNSYGWIAENMNISGLEDEYRISASKPKLIYIKNSEQRQPRLNEMILEIQKQGDISYKIFSDTKELKEYITNDLASLLSERFLESKSDSGLDKKILFNSIPVPFHPIIGRDHEVHEICEWILNRHTRLISLTGMGGTGKSRLAIELGTRLLNQFKHGVSFISLASIKDSTQIEACIALALSISDSSKQALRETILSYLSDKNILLILDNFEHVLKGATIVSDILSRSRSIVILVTSRTPLNLRVEQLYPLAPLPTLEDLPILKSEAMAIPAMNLFIERANSINSKIDWNKENLLAAKNICHCVGGLPLAIELAAMRVKHMAPMVLWKGMQKSLDILNSGAMDLPDRQQSFRATLDWSYHLLDPNDQRIFKISSLFQNGWYIDGLIKISNQTKDQCQACIEKLIDAGLVLVMNIDHHGVRYDKLQPIDEYADELFEMEHDSHELKQTYTEYYIQMATIIEKSAFKINYSQDWIPWIIAEYENFRKAFQYCIKTNNLQGAYNIIIGLGAFWLYYGSQNEALRWIKEVGINTAVKVNGLTNEEISNYAKCLMYSGTFKFFQGEFSAVTVELNAAKSLFSSIQEWVNIARCNIYLGLTGLSTFNLDTEKLFDEALETGIKSNDMYSVFLSMTFKAEYFCLIQNLDKAKLQIENAGKLLTNGFPGDTEGSIDDLKPLYYIVKGNVLLVCGDLEMASSAFNESIKLFEESGFKNSLGYALVGLAVVNILKGDISTARKIILRGLNIGREQGDVVVILVHLKLLLACQMVSDQSEFIFKLMDEINAHFNDINYRQWSVDALITKWIQELLKAKDIAYSTELKPAQMNLDKLIQAVLSQCQA